MKLLINNPYHTLRNSFFSAANLPEKTTVYSTLVGLLNAKNYGCGEEVSFLISAKYAIVMAYSIVGCSPLT